MKILNRTQFLAMPENTLFCKYEPCVFGDVAIKGESLSNDFFVQYISGAVDYEDTEDFCETLESAEKTGASFAMDFNCEGRDGMFDDDELFAVFDPEDVKALIERLQRCVK